MKLYLKNLITISTFDSKTGFYKQEINKSEIIDGVIDSTSAYLFMQLNLYLLEPLIRFNSNRILPLREILYRTSNNFETEIEKQSVITKFISHVKNIFKNINFSDLEMTYEECVKLLDQCDLSKGTPDELNEKINTITKHIDSFRKDASILTNESANMTLILSLKNLVNTQDLTDEKVIQQIISKLIELNSIPSFQIIYSLISSIFTAGYIMAMDDYKIVRVNSDKKVVKSPIQRNTLELIVDIVAGKYQRWIYESRDWLNNFKDNHISNIYKNSTLNASLKSLYGNKMTYTNNIDLLHLVDGAYNKTLNNSQLIIFKNVANQLNTSVTTIATEKLIPFYHIYYTLGTFNNIKLHYEIMLIRFTLMVKAVLHALKMKVPVEKLYYTLLPYYNHVKYPNSDIMEHLNPNKFLSGVITPAKIVYGLKWVMEFVGVTPAGKEIIQTIKKIHKNPNKHESD